MTAVVMNTATGAVTEYSWNFQSLTDAHGALPSGLFTLGGALDAGTAITAELRTGTPGGEKTQGVNKVFVAGETVGGVLIVQGAANAWEFPVVSRAGGVGYAQPARGIRESYLGFGYRNVAGADFRIDRIDIDVDLSTNRRK